MEHFLSFYMYNRFSCVNLWLATQSKAWINSGFLRDSNPVQRSSNRPHSRYSPSSHALIKDLRDKSNVTWFLRGQTSDKINRYKKRQSSLFQTTEKKEIFLLKTTIEKLWGEVIFATFFGCSSDRGCPHRKLLWCKTCQNSNCSNILPDLTE